MELSRKAEKSYLIRRLSGVAPYDFPYRKKILKSMSLKQLRVTVYILLAILCGELSDKIEKMAVERCRSWHKNSDSAKNRAA